MVLLFAHAVVIGLFGSRIPGPLLSNLIQLTLGSMTVGCCILAARRSGAFGRMFWKLAGAGFSLWCIGQALGTYYSSILNLSTQNFWGIDMFFTAWSAPLVMCLFVDQKEEAGRFDWKRVLDFSQVGIVFILLYFFFSNSSRYGSPLGIWRTSVVVEGIVTIGFFARASSAGPGAVGTLFRRIGYFRLVAFLTDLCFALQIPAPPDNSWFDLVWSVPWLIPLMAAAYWDGEGAAEAEVATRLQKQRLIVTQVLPLLSPLLVLLLAAEVAPGQLAVAAFAVLGSLGVSYTRMILTNREQMKTVETQRQQHGLLQAIIDGTTEAVYVKDAQGRYLMINAAGAGMLGRKVEEVIGKNDSEFFSAETARQIMERDLKIMDGGQSRTLEEHVEIDEASRTFLATKGPYRDGRGNIIGLVGIAVDITERNRAAAALAESEERFRTLFQGSPIGISVIDMGGKVFELNPACRKMLGIGPDELVSTKLFDELTHPDSREKDEARYAELVNGNCDQVRMEKRHLLRNKKEVWADLHLFLLRDHQGHPSYVIGMSMDITERKLLEEQLRRAQRMETIGTLAGGVAHDFNNLLTVIKGYCDLMMERVKKEADLMGYMGQIDHAAEHAASMTRQLLAFSRQQVLQPKIFNLNELVTNADKMLRRLIGENIEMETVTAAEAGSVMADPGQIESVIMNLAVNARDAMPNGGKLTLETANVELDEAYAQQHFGSKPGSYVMLAVSDTGIGMDAETKSHIFEPFFTTKELGKGTGLGLSTVYGVVKQSEGYIWAYSEPGKGATFKIYLPRVDKPAEGMPLKAPSTTGSLGNETILLVEDDSQVRELTKAILESRGYRVLAMDDSSKALEICKSHGGAIGLLLTDVVMPGMGGRELAERVVKQRPEIKVLFISGYTDNAVIHGGVLGTGSAFLQKPFTPSSLSDKVREILNQPSK
jgi:PAS domain S-box-containing protein